MALVRTTAFVLSSLLATVAAVLIGGYAGVTAQVGTGLEFVAITAVVLGGVVLGGGQGWVTAAMCGALVLGGLFTLFNQLGLPSTARPGRSGRHHHRRRRPGSQVGERGLRTRRCRPAAHRRPRHRSRRGSRQAAVRGATPVPNGTTQFKRFG